MKSIRTLFFLASFLLLGVTNLIASSREIKLSSPDGKTDALISVGQTIKYSISQDGVEVLAPSQISMTLNDGTIWGISPELLNVEEESVDEIIETPRNKSTEIKNQYNGVVLDFKEWKLEFRAFDDAIAYRFISEKEGAYEIKNELVDYTFVNDAVATVPYVQNAGDLEFQFFQSFENTYTTLPISDLDKNRLMFLPLSVEAPDDKRVTITESDLRDYPGMYLVANQSQNTLTGLFAPVRDSIDYHSGYNNLQVTVKSRHDYIAEVDGPRSFPWRIAIISSNDVELANSDVVYKLATPNLIGDTSWVKPGKVAWDWWNNWNLEGVDFKAGINNETYKYYIDFASKNGIEYVILDEGWAVNKASDLMQVVPEIDLEELIEYADKRDVGIFLWAGYTAFDEDMEEVSKHYSKMGVKGFKIDFMNGDDQDLVEFNERAAATTAKYKLMLDIHGTYKPTGLDRTYPNIVNYEGVHGLEQMKWQPSTVDQVTYDVTMPFIRMVAGPVDYTQGAMRNTTKTYNSLKDTIENQYFPSFTRPMSQGTRAHQFAQYIIYLSPLNMLSDTPTNYEKEVESTEFISSIPTTWDESKVIEGEMGEYIITARRKGNKWYIGGLNNWTPRDVKLNVKDITGKSGKATIYIDGPNAANHAEDFQKKTISTEGNITIHMASGGGFVLEI